VKRGCGSSSIAALPTPFFLSPFGKRSVLFQNGSTPSSWPMAERSIGRSPSAISSFLRAKGHTPVILGEEDDEALLGVVTLEILGLVFNPFKRTLRADADASHLDPEFTGLSDQAWKKVNDTGQRSSR